MNRSDSNTIILAEKLYCYEGYTIQKVADTVGKAEKTIRLWKQKHEWDKKKSDYMKSISDLPAQLYDDYTTIMEAIREDLREKRKPSQAMCNLAAKLFEQIPKAKAVEQAAGTSNDKTPKNIEEVRSAIREAVRKELGLE